MVTPVFMARFPEIWSSPDDFIPERFHKANQKSVPFNYVPFSGGSRNCIGQKFAMLEMKTAISKILRNFELSLAANFEPILVMGLTLKPENGILLKIESRKID